MVLLERIATERGTFPAFVRMDNGPELTASALGDWCRFGGTSPPATSSRTAHGRTPWVESYGSRMWLLAVEQFDCVFEAQVLVANWREEYNTYRPHSRPRHAHASRVCQVVADHQLQLT